MPGRNYHRECHENFYINQIIPTFKRRRGQSFTIRCSPSRIRLTSECFTTVPYPTNESFEFTTVHNTNNGILGSEPLATADWYLVGMMYSANHHRFKFCPRRTKPLTVELLDLVSTGQLQFPETVTLPNGDHIVGIICKSKTSKNLIGHHCQFDFYVAFFLTV